MAVDVPGHGANIGQRFLAEMYQFATVSLYLWVCFSVLVMYKTAILQAQGVPFVPLGLSLVKALIIGKFILLGKAAGVGSRMAPAHLLYRILWKSVAFLVLLMLLTVLEEVIVGLVHGHTLAASTAKFTDRSWLENTAPSVLMLLVLVPLITFEEIDRALGQGTLRRLLFSDPDSH